MSVSALGMPINMGLTHGLIGESTYSLLCNPLPQYIMFEYVTNPMEFDTEGALQTYTNDNYNILYPGMGVFIKDVDQDKIGLQGMQYIWDKVKWQKIGNPYNKEYLNIFGVEFKEHESGYTETIISFFMRMYLKNIKSNIKLLSLLDKKYAIRSNEFLAFCSLNGKYNISNVKTGNIFSYLMAINVSSALNYFFRKICNVYNVPAIKFNAFIDSAIRSVDRVIADTYHTFTQLYYDTIEIDISMYINYITACYASFLNIFHSMYSDGMTMNVLQPLGELTLIDKPLYNRINMSGIVKNHFETILGIIDQIIYRDAIDNPKTKIATDNFFTEYKDLINHFKNYNEKLFSNINTRKAFLTNICEGIAGIIGLALYFTILSNGDPKTRTTLHLHFITPKKYQEVN